MILKTLRGFNVCLLLGPSVSAKTALTMCTNFLLKHCGAVLAKLKDNNSFESFMDLRNALLSGSMNLFLNEAVEKAIKKSVRVLHEEAIRKAVSRGKPAKSPPSRSSFLSLLGNLSSLRDLISSSLGRVCPPPVPLVPRLLPPPADVGWGRNFESFLPPSQLQVGGVLGRHWASWSSNGAGVWTVEVL